MLTFLMFAAVIGFAVVMRERTKAQNNAIPSNDHNQLSS